MSHAETITEALETAGSLTRAELLEVTGIKDTVLDATLTTMRKRGRIARSSDGRSWELGDDSTDGEGLVRPAQQVQQQAMAETPTTATDEPVKPAPVVKAIAPASVVQQAPAPKTEFEHFAQCGNLRISIRGCSMHEALPILSAALRAAAERVQS